MSKEYCAYLADILSPWGAVTHRAMFGGYGLYRDAIIFGFLVDGELYLKVDGLNKCDFQAISSHPFVYEAKGKAMEMSYWHLPEYMIEEADIFIEWAEKSYQASIRNIKTKNSKR